MTLITAVENITGPIESWPSHVLEYLFGEIPNVDAMVELIAFFYGNGIPCPMASQLYHVWDPLSSAEVNEHIYKTYSY